MMPYDPTKSVDLSDIYSRLSKLESQLTAEREARQKAEALCIQQGKQLGSITEKLLAAEYRIKASQEQELWTALTKSGQIQVGDEVRFLLPSGIIEAVAHEVLYAGTDKEEVVYNRKKNHYFITSMAIDGTSSHKDVAFRRKQPLIPPEVAELQRENAELARKLAEQHRTNESLTDMLEDARTELQCIRAALGIEYEPHQTLSDRTLDACRSVAELTKRSKAAGCAGRVEVGSD